MNSCDVTPRPANRACDTLLQVAKATHSQPLQTALSRSGGLEAARWRNPKIAATLDPTDRHMLIFHERGSTQVEGRIGSAVRGHGSRIGSVTAVPAGVVSHWHLHGPCDVIHVYVETSRLCAADGRVRPLEPMFAREDRWLQHWFGLLSSELSDAQHDGEALAPLLADEFEGLLVAHLLSGTTRQPRQRGGLPGGALRRIDAFVIEHLHEELRLDDLARSAHLSPGHFIRAFRQSVGCTPWQYVLERRLQAAEPLLRQGMPADDVARRVGLVNVARLSRLFRQRRGVGLSQWRRLDGGPG